MPTMTDEEKEQNWSNFIQEFFPEGVPTTKEWTGVASIAEQLNKIGYNTSKAYNHTFMPGGGGLDLHGAKVSEYERGCIEVDFDGLIHIVKPSKLIFHSFDSDPEWFYFRLESDNLAPSGVYETSNDFDYEEVCRLPDGSYINRSYYDHGYYGSDENGNQKRLPREARVVCRQLKGDFVTFGKFSAYNKNSSTYDGRHNKMTDDQFREHIQGAITHLKEKQQKNS